MKVHGVLLIISFLFISYVYSQEKTGVKLDTTILPVSPLFYVRDLNIKPIQNTDQIEISWKSHRNVKYFMVEIRDENTDSLFYRQKHNHYQLRFPSKGRFTVIPLTNKRQGIPLSLSLQEARERNFEPKNTSRNLELKKRKTERLEKQLQQEKEFKEKQHELQEEKDRSSTVIGIVVFAITAIFALIVVLIVWLINRTKKAPVKSTYNAEFDRDFERKK